MFQLILEKIDKAVENQSACTLIDKMGKYHYGRILDSWARLSGGKIRGKIRFASENQELEIDANDILDVRLDERGSH